MHYFLQIIKVVRVVLNQPRRASRRHDWRRVLSDMMADTELSMEGETVRLAVAPSLPALFKPWISPGQVRRNLRFGILLRWVAIGFAGLAGVMVTRPPQLLFFLMLAAMAYNLALMVAVGKATDRAAPRVALVATVCDQFVCLGYITIYGANIVHGDQVAPYVVGLVEAISYFGIPGAILSVSIFFAYSAASQILAWQVGHTPMSMSWLLGSTLVIVFLAVTLVPVFRILMTPSEPAEQAPSLRLSKREQEVLRLVAEGYSNSMIASRLNLSDNTVKSYVESLLMHLNARNRAEAVAAASRLKLL